MKKEQVIKALKNCTSGISTGCQDCPYKKNNSYTCRNGKLLYDALNLLNTIVERLDELLGKGINDYIMGIDGVEGIQDMWERSAVRAFAEKVKAKSYVNNYCREVVEIDKIDELLKEYE